MFKAVLKLNSTILAAAISMASCGAPESKKDSTLEASNPTGYGIGLIRTNKSSYTIGGDSVRFGWRIANCSEDSLRAAAIAIKNNAKTDAWDDAWYALPVNQGKCMMFGWYNLSRSKFGWAAVQNRPSSWGARSNYSGWVDLGNGDKKKYSYTINGQPVDLDVFNPYNQGTVSGNDIFFGFGW